MTSSYGNVTLLEGSVLLQQGELDAAYDSYTKELQNDPDNLEAIYGMGIIAQYRDDFETAKVFFQKALAFEDVSSQILNT